MLNFYPFLSYFISLFFIGKPSVCKYYWNCWLIHVGDQKRPEGTWLVLLKGRRGSGQGWDVARSSFWGWTFFYRQVTIGYKWLTWIVFNMNGHDWITKQLTVGGMIKITSGWNGKSWSSIMIIPWIMKITCGWNRRREAGRRQRRWSPTPLILIIMIIYVFIMMIIAITIMIHHHHHHDPNYHNCLHFNHHHHDPDYRPHSWFWFSWLSFFLISSWSWSW